MDALTELTPSSAPEEGDGFDAFYFPSVALTSLGLLGNAFVCLVMLRYSSVFQSTTNKLIIHQCTIDFLAALVFLLRRHLMISSGVPDGVRGWLYCRLWWSEWPQYGLFVTSTYNMMAISLERYFATCQSVKYRNLFSRRRVKVIVAAVWLSGWVSEAHLLPISYRTDDGGCDISWPNSGVQVVGGIFVFLWELLIPLSVMIFAYARIIWELRQRSKARARGVKKDDQNMLSRANRNVTKTLIVVTISFAICWAPTDINYIMYNLGLNENATDSVVYQITGAVVVVNLCINPIIYCFAYNRFQKQAKKMVFGKCIRRSNRVDDQVTTVSRNTQGQNT